jgi:glycosyltransferase involved in cell wall biosynthesis
MSLAGKGIGVDLIGSDDLDVDEFHRCPSIAFLNLRGSRDPDVGPIERARRVGVYYLRLLQYAATAEPEIFHILWNNKFQWFDRTLLMLCYRILGKKVAFTAHNVNSGKRDLDDSFLNRLTLKVQYKLSHHIFVHTEKMKQELVEEFLVAPNKVSVIPYGINNAIPDTPLTSSQARRELGIRNEERTVLFFGNITPYKGLEYLTGAFERLIAKDGRYRLIVAGDVKQGAALYWDRLQRRLRPLVTEGRVTLDIRHVPDRQAEVYFKAADVFVLPYREIFQSGVLFLGYNFGLPVIASDVGSFRADVVDGRTGFVCRPDDSEELARTIEAYFASDLFQNLAQHRPEIRDHARASHSWGTVADLTKSVYTSLLTGAMSEQVER